MPIYSTCWYTILIVQAADILYVLNSYFLMDRWSISIPEQYAFQYADFNSYITEEVISYFNTL
jgi:hypothetical protein